MQQRAPTPLDSLAELPTCRKLAQARAKLEEARQASEAARAEFSEHCRRIVARGSMLLDAEATKAESEAIRTAAAARLAHGEVEAGKRAHGSAVLARHFAKHEAAALEMMVEPMRDARDAARKIVYVLEAGERDGATPSYQLNKAKRALRLLNDALGSFQ